MDSKREVWVDYIKVFACILVVLGHFFQSMVKANILPDNSLFQWFNTTIYYFHVPLFFICSGYLYQKYSKVDSISSWRKNLIKKAIVLGVPYVVFSIATWLLKILFSGAVNDEIGGIIDTLIIHPVSPYWYLHTLFFFFVLVPTINDKRGALILIGVSMLLKAYSIIGGDTVIFQIYTINSICKNLIWFSIGIFYAKKDINLPHRRMIGAILGIGFIGLSFTTYEFENGFIGCAMGVVACASVIMLFHSISPNKVLDWMAKYTMPVFLFHTLFAAPLRTILLMGRIDNWIIHIVGGIMITFIGPIIAMIILEKVHLDWIIYPGLLKKKIKRES